MKLGWYFWKSGDFFYSNLVGGDNLTTAKNVRLEYLR